MKSCGTVVYITALHNEFAACNPHARSNAHFRSERSSASSDHSVGINIRAVDRNKFRAVCNIYACRRICFVFADAALRRKFAACDIYAAAIARSGVCVYNVFLARASAGNINTCAVCSFVVLKHTAHIVYAVCNIYAASVARSGVLGYKPVNSLSDRAVVEIKTGAVRCGVVLNVTVFVAFHSERTAVNVNAAALFRGIITHRAARYNKFGIYANVNATAERSAVGIIFHTYFGVRQNKVASVFNKNAAAFHCVSADNTSAVCKNAASRSNFQSA